MVVNSNSIVYNIFNLIKNCKSIFILDGLFVLVQEIGEFGYTDIGEMNITMSNLKLKDF